MHIIFVKNNILVFPSGIVSTSIYVYLLCKWSLLEDMMINGYYLGVSVSEIKCYKKRAYSAWPVGAVAQPIMLFDGIE